MPSQQALEVGQKVEVSIPAGRLRSFAFVLFGLPLLAALTCCGLGNLVALNPAALGAAAIAGFGLGALASFQLRGQMQRKFDSLLTIKTLDC